MSNGRRYLAALLLSAGLHGLDGTALAQPVADEQLVALETRIERLEGRTTAGIPLQASWQNGIRLQSEDGAVRLQLGGRVQADFAGVDAESAVEEEIGNLRSGTKMRRARVYFSGTLYEYSHFRVEYDFLGGNANLRDAYIGVTGVPFLGTIRVGRMLEFYSLEQLSGNSFHQFMERGLPAAFNEYWNNGIGIQNAVLDRRATWAVGASKRTDNFGDSGTNSEHNVSARVTAAPVYRDDGRTWMHLGAATIQRKPDRREYAIGATPESSLAPRFVGTGPIPSDRVNLVGLEFVATHGPASIQAEWHQARVDLRETEDFPHSGTATLDGYYVYASYFLTGEHRTYNRQAGTFGRTIPRSNFRGEGHGGGAWEIAVRLSELDLSDDPVDGGRLRDWTVGVNWYLNPNMRLMWNYVRADLKDVGEANIYQMRAQFDF